MKWEISNNKRKTTLAIGAALVAFGTALLLTGIIMTQVYGLKPGDEGYKHYFHYDGTPNTPYEDIIVNGCSTKEIIEGDEVIILDSKDLSEYGDSMFYPELCLEVVKDIIDYKVTNIEFYGENNEQMKITLTKK